MGGSGSARPGGKSKFTFKFYLSIFPWPIAADNFLLHCLFKRYSISIDFHFNLDYVLNFKNVSRMTLNWNLFLICSVLISFLPNYNFIFMFFSFLLLIKREYSL